MVERSGVGDRHSEILKPDHILRHGDNFLDGQVAIPAKGFQRLHIFPATDEQRVVYCNEMTTVFDQGADLVDQAGTIVFQIHSASGRRGKEGRIDDDAIEELPGTFEFCNRWKKILCDEVPFMDGESIERIGIFCEIQELAIEVGLDHAAGSARQSGDPKTAGVGEGVQNRSGLHVIDQPFSQATGIDIETRIPVQGEVNGVPNAMLPYFFIDHSAE